MLGSDFKILVLDLNRSSYGFNSFGPDLNTESDWSRIGPDLNRIGPDLNNISPELSTPTPDVNRL